MQGMFAILFRRSWLFWAPILVASQLALAWIVDRWVPWEWVLSLIHI